MKKVLLLLLVFSLSLLMYSNYFSGNAGIGLKAGEPSGIYGRYNIADYNIVDATIAWSFWGAHVTVAGGYSFVENLGDDLYARYGLGVKTSFGLKFKLSAGVPLAVEYIIREVPLTIFLEVFPAIKILDKFGFEINGGVGFVYYF